MAKSTSIIKALFLQVTGMGLVQYLHVKVPIQIQVDAYLTNNVNISPTTHIDFIIPVVLHAKTYQGNK